MALGSVPPALYCAFSQFWAPCCLVRLNSIPATHREMCDHVCSWQLSVVSPITLPKAVPSTKLQKQHEILLPCNQCGFVLPWKKLMVKSSLLPRAPSHYQASSVIVTLQNRRIFPKIPSCFSGLAAAQRRILWSHVCLWQANASVLGSTAMG